MTLAPIVLQVMQSDLSTLVADLNDGNFVTVRQFSLGTPNVEEFWFFTPDADDGIMTKSRDRPRKAEMTLRILPASTATLAAFGAGPYGAGPYGGSSAMLMQNVAYVIASAFNADGHYLRRQYAGGAVDHFKIFPSRIEAITIDPVVALRGSAFEWGVSFWIASKPVGSSVVMPM